MFTRASVLPSFVIALSLLFPAVFPAHAAPPPMAAKDPNWYKRALELHQEGLRDYQERRFDSAIEKLEQALAISEDNNSNEYVMLTIGYLVPMYVRKRDFVRTEELSQRKLEIAQKTMPPNSPALAVVLAEVGDFYFQVGEFDRAEALLEKGAAIAPNGTGIAAMAAVVPLANLAKLRVAQGKLDIAESLFQRVLAIQESALGNEHPQLVPILSSLGTVAHHKGDLKRAEEIVGRACEILKAANATNGYPYAQCLANLGYVLQSKGELNQAKELVEKSLDMQRNGFGPSDPRVSWTLTALGHIQQAMGDISTATKTYDAAIAVNDRDLDMVMVAGSESQKRDFLGRLAKQTEGVVSLHLTAAPNDPAARALALRTILRRKGKVLDAVAQNVSSFRERMVGEEVELFDQLAAARADLARAVLGGVGAPPLGSPQQKKLEEEARARIERLEKELGKHSERFGGPTEEITIERIQASLPKDAALVEFIRFRPFNPKWKKLDEAWEPARYAAYLLTASGDPEAFDLGPAVDIDKRIKDLRTASSHAHGKDAFSLAQAVDEKLLRPILGKIDALPPLPAGNPRTVFLAPDAALNLVSFAALVDEHGKHRVETFAFDYLTTGRDLLRFTLKARAPRQRPFVLANADFGPRQPKGTVTSSFNVYFPPLPGTIEEGRIVAALLPGSTLVTEKKAIEQTVKDLHGPEALHMATHGFFLGEPKSMEGNTRALELEMSNVANSGSGPKTLQVPMENPLLKSGLALAGANLRKGAEDGLLTALEVSSMDLSGTKLVVLSACETGLGDISTGEGVYGLRRAFSMAGAQSILMSLWEVDDEATRDLMIAYYQRMAAGEGRAEALRTAQLALLRDKKHAHPYYWAAFLASGDPRPVEFAVVPPGGIPKATAPGKNGCACDIAGREPSNGVWGLLLLATMLGRRHLRKVRTLPNSRRKR